MPIERFETLKCEFEAKLHRLLTDKEQEFIQWIVIRERENEGK